MSDADALPAPRIETTRLVLFPLPPEAAATLAENRERAAELIGAPLAPDWPQPDLLRILPRQASASPAAAAFGIWLIAERASGTVVGDVGFRGPPAEDGIVELGYSVAPASRRRGYAVEAVRAIVAWALPQPVVGGVAARCDPDNVASISVLERTGFGRDRQVGGLLGWVFEGS